MSPDLENKPELPLLHGLTLLLKSLIRSILFNVYRVGSEVLAQEAKNIQDLPAKFWERAGNGTKRAVACPKEFTVATKLRKIPIFGGSLFE